MPQEALLSAVGFRSLKLLADEPAHGHSSIA